MVRPSALRAEDDLSPVREEADDMLVERQAKNLKKSTKRKLVRCQHLMTIAAAWVITVPAAAGLAALLFKILEALNAG